MTQDEWDRCTDPGKMLELLRGKVSDRKLRLFAVACCRRIWHRLAGDRSQRLVEASEQVLEGVLDKDGFEPTAATLVEILSPTTGRFYSHERPTSPPFVTVGSHVNPGTVVCWIEAMKIFNEIQAECSGVITEALVTDQAAVEYGAPLFRVVPTVPAEARGGAENSPVSLVREVFGNPVRPDGVDLAWLRWSDGAVGSLARTVYEDRDLPSGHLDAARLALLADMVEEVGCTDADILGHLRGAGPHPRGCWAVDLLLGKA